MYDLSSSDLLTGLDDGLGFHSPSSLWNYPEIGTSLRIKDPFILVAARR